MRNHLCIFCLILLSACSPRFDPCWPGFESDLSYEYACSRASKGCHLCLSEHGYISYVVIGKLEKDWHGLKKSGEIHSWIEVAKDGQIWWLDPSWDKCYKKSQWTDRQPMVRYRMSEAGIVDWEAF